MCNSKRTMKSFFLTILCMFGVFTLQSCDENDLPFTRHLNGTVTDIHGKTCKADNGNWADCYPETFQSSCKDGKAVVCGNAYTNFEIFEYECDCKMVNGKATCGECEPGDLDTSTDRIVKICNPAGLWEEIPYRLDHPDEMQKCDPATYRAKCVHIDSATDKAHTQRTEARADNNTGMINNIALNCDVLSGRIVASRCQENIYSANSCVEVDEEFDEVEFNQYTLVCEDTQHRAYCSYCKPGEEAEAETVCLDGDSLNAAAVKCSEYGFWMDKATNGIPKYKDCNGPCLLGKCLEGKKVPCTENALEGHVCYTEDSMVMNRVWCDIYGNYYNNQEPLDLVYCSKGCVNNECRN